MSTGFKTLLLAHHTGDTSAAGRAIADFSGRVAQRSGGLLNIADMPGSTLGNIPALLRLVMDGKADMAFAPFDRLCELIPKFGFVGMPFVFDDLAHADRVLNGPFADWALPDLLQRGLHSLSSWEWGRRQISNRVRPLQQPADLAGLRIRVPPIAINLDAIQALGAMPVVVEFARLIPALRQGMVDGQENPVAIIHGYRLYEQQRYLSLLDYSYGGMLHIINRRSFEALSAEHQKILAEESRQAGQAMRLALRTEELSQIEALRTAGMRIERPDPQPFRIALQPARERLIERFGAARGGSFLAMVEHLRAGPATEDAV
ncbi:TRAP transporter substrate-binding protein [Uliginosibacterium aquaticum]|uniref:TRAP transporter substrate-binding protein n=1 Tax=Uliginosibacterium aquaticum TaxID=2731212 RepID=A0ABX2IEQ5_9RHOO|nr:TRAP transporter substrate-binding protein [Uliginosibacterium aquaticum]NSL55160.1 TRAP transporter substrate-binding protein [Uliginosibacterium aquaticum]